MRWSVGVILIALAACGTEDKSCDSLQYNLAFHADDTHPNEYVDSDTYAVDPRFLAVGGTERFTVEAVDGCGSAGSPGRLGVYSVDESLATVTPTATGATFDLHGLAPGFADVGAADEFGMTKHMGVTVRAIDSVRLVADEVGAPGAFFVGIPQVKVQLLARGQWLVDRDLAVGGPIAKGAAWNLLDTAGLDPGTYAEDVFAGGSTWPITVTIVDHLDDIVAGEPTGAVPYRSEKVCFFAHTGGAVVAGVPWTFDYEPGGGRVDLPNCVVVWATSSQEEMTTVTAHALGMSASSTVAFPR
jgi:hypothetical protein